MEWNDNNLPLESGNGNVNKPSSVLNKISVVIYTRNNCPYCIRAKNLLDGKRLQYKEIDVVDSSSSEFKKMLELSKGISTVPQIFIGERHIAGFTQLKNLNDNGELDKMLEQIYKA